MFHATGLSRWQRAMAAEPVATPPAPSPEVSMEQELASLQAQANEAAATLEQIRQRIDELSATRSQEAPE